MADYVSQTWGEWNESEQVAKHRQNYDPSTHELVLVGESVAGLVATEVEPTHVWLVKLYLLPEFRCRGLGTALLEEVKTRARLLRKPVRLRVLRVNSRAKWLYERHGFRVTEETPERFFMESDA